MLTRFEVANYKGFKDAMIWDLSTTRDYSYSKELIKPLYSLLLPLCKTTQKKSFL